SAALCLALAAACSSSSSQSSTGANTGSSTGTNTGSSAASGSPINVGAVQTASGAYGDPLWLTIANVWAQWTNAHGGINGHPVQLTGVDDAGNPAQALSAVKGLVQQHHVVAIIGSNTGTASSWLPYLQQNNIPLIGGAAAGGGLSGSFPPSLSVSSLVTASFQLDKQVGLTKVAELLALGGAFNLSTFEGQLRQAAESAGVGIVYAAGVSPTAPDYT